MDESLPDAIAFEPVPSASTRHDGWTPERQREFIHQLARIGLVSAAARSVGMSPKSAYALRKRAGPGSTFVAAWDAALAQGGRQAEFLAIDRAIEGVEVPYFYGGIQRGTRRVYDNRLLLAALKLVDRRKAAQAEPRPSARRDLR